MHAIIQSPQGLEDNLRYVFLTIDRIQRNFEYGWGCFLRVIRLPLLAHRSWGHVVVRGLVPEGPPEVDSILKPPPNSIKKIF